MAKAFGSVILLLVLAFSCLVDAQSNSTSALEVLAAELPSCALTCLLVAVKDSSCAITDIDCQCKDEALSATTEVCIISSCTVKESLVAKNVTQTNCNAPIRDRSFESNLVTFILMGCSCIVVLARLCYNQFLSAAGLGIDDWFILLTLTISVPSSVVNVVYLTANGLGKDIWTLTTDEIAKFAQGFYMNAILYFSVVPVLKLSILFFYLRIFPGRLIQRLLWGTVTFNILFGIAFVFTAAFQCTPVSYNWTNWEGEGGGTCVNINAVAWANAGISIFLDLWMLAIPLSQLHNLKLHWKKKISVACMFFVGTFVTVLSIIRLYSLVEFRSSDNLTWDYWSLSLWSSMEITIGMICACMPSIRVMLMRIVPGILSSTRGHTNPYYQRYGSGVDGKTGGSVSASNGQKEPTSLRIYKYTDWNITQSPSDEALQRNASMGGHVRDTRQGIPMETFDGRSHL